MLASACACARQTWMSAAQLEPGIGPGDLYFDPEKEKTAVSI